MAYAVVIDLPKGELAANANKIVGLGVDQPKDQVVSGAAAVVVNSGPVVVADKHQKTAAYVTGAGASVTLTPARRGASKGLIRPDLLGRRTGKGVGGTGVSANDVRTATSPFVQVQKAAGTLRYTWSTTLTDLTYDVMAIVIDAGNVSAPYYIDIATPGSATFIDISLKREDGVAATVSQTFSGLSTVTGVVLSPDATTGCANGSTYALAYTAAGTLLSFGGGVAQNVGAGGPFTLVDSTTNNKVLVTVTAALLPAGNVTDTIVVGGCPTFMFIGSRSA
jgi:hypothetical protein